MVIPDPVTPVRRPCHVRLCFLLLSLLGNIFLLSATDIPAAKDRLRVLVSLPAYFSWTSQIGGRWVTVEPLLPDNADPHQFQFRPRDLQRLRTANLIVLNGAGLEDWLKPVLQKQAPDSASKIVEISAGYPRSNWIFDGHPGDGDTPSIQPRDATGFPNPHFWLDPVFAAYAVTNLLQILQDAAPAHADAFRTNASVYLDRLRKLDADFAAFRKPLQSPTIVTVHPAFPYLCQRYQLPLIGTLEIVPGVEPSPRHLSRLIREIRAHGVTTLFVETHSDSRLAKQLASDLNLSTAELDTLETGAWSASGYEDGMRRNLSTLVRCLH